MDVVLCTHLHFDHVGWNTMKADGRWVPTFPQARYLFARAEWDHWSAQPEAGFAPPARGARWRCAGCRFSNAPAQRACESEGPVSS